jgi:hypothetical protein
MTRVGDCRALLLVLSASALGGCGATTVRLEAAPTVDTGGRVGAEGRFSLGIGWPLDFRGRSHHFIQGLTSIGGGRDGQTGKGMVTAGTAIDYIYWAEPRMDVRVGTHFAYRKVPPGGPISTSLYGIGGHLGLMPIVWGNDSSWAVQHFCIGPELRLEYMASDPSGSSRGLFSLPLVTEFNFLAAGD